MIPAKSVLRIGISFVVLFLTTPALFPVSVFAQEAVSPLLYRSMEQRLKIEQLLAGKDPLTLTQPELEELMRQTANTGELPYVGEIIQTDGTWKATTGLSGSSQGAIPRGVYRLVMDSIPDIVVRLPENVVVDGAAETTIVIPMKERPGKGTVDYASSRGFIEEVVNWLSGLFRQPMPQQASTTPVGQSLLPVALKLFHDANGDGIQGPSESRVPWANVSVALQKISTEETVALTSGNTTVSFPSVPANARTIYELLGVILASGQPEAIVVSSDKGVPMSVVAKGAEYYGLDRPIKPNTPYVVTVPSEGTLRLMYTK